VGEIAGKALLWDGFDAPAPQPIADAAKRLAALTGRADVLKATTLYDQAEASLRGEIARQYPAISIGPGYTWERGLVKIPINLALVLPPLDGNRGAIAAAEARRAEAGANVEASVAAAAAAIDLALADTRQARAQLAQVRSGELPAAQRLALQADHELAAGAIDRGEWAAAQAGAGLARLTELDALAVVHAADAELETALRRPVEGPELAIRRRLVVMQ
jgi:CRISPR system Cascade subunit CasA